MTHRNEFGGAFGALGIAKSKSRFWDAAVVRGMDKKNQLSRLGWRADILTSPLSHGSFIMEKPQLVNLL